jgi:DNA repair protein RecO (recombination protein O)
MDERTSGLVLRVRPLTETSLIVQWLTRDFGRISTVAKGARRTKSPFRGKLDLFYLAEFSLQRSQRGELHSLREVSVQEFHEPLRQSVKLLQQAAYLVQLLEQSTEKETPLPGFLELMTEALNTLVLGPPRLLNVFAFEMKLLSRLGFKPDLASTDLSAGSREILELTERSKWQTVTRLELSSAQIREISRFLDRFLSYHLGRVPAGRAQALTI